MCEGHLSQIKVTATQFTPGAEDITSNNMGKDVKKQLALSSILGARGNRSKGRRIHEGHLSKIKATATELRPKTTTATDVKK